MIQERDRSRNEAEILLDRAEPPREKRYIYGGETRPVPQGYVVRPNRRSGSRRVSTFYVILLLFGAGIASVFYVNSILTINRLVLDVDRLQAKYDAVQNTNAALRAEVSRKSSWERISAIATQQLGLVFPKEQPTVLEVDGRSSGVNRVEGGR